MDIALSEIEARIIGTLIEKEITTPDQYPMSLNALTNACNQKSNRNPVMGLGQLQVQAVVDGLMKRHFVTDRSGFGSRVTKYKHRFCNSEFGQLKFSEQELAVMCELLLRGPQTPGELRSHASRMCRLSDVGEVEVVLRELAEREDGPYVMRLAREPGRRESRYQHLFFGDQPQLAEPGEAAPVASSAHSGSRGDEESRLDRLEQQVARLQEELDLLKQSLGD